jgi:hypothetical protein
MAVIKEGKRSGMRADAIKPTFVVGRPTWQHSLIWYAGAIAHDYHHSKLYHEAKANDKRKKALAESWTGIDAEKKCLAFQMEVLESLHADESMMAYLKGLQRNPTYQGRHRGWKAWRDYFTRWW